MNANAREQASAILADVKAKGEEGLLEAAVRLGDLTAGAPHVRTKEECEAAYLSLPQDQQSLLLRTASRIRTFAEAQLASVSSTEIDIPGGEFASQSLTTLRGGREGGENGINREFY